MEEEIMKAGKETILRFPIEKIFFIITVGLFVVVSFPFDLFKDLANGMPQLDFVNWWRDLSAYVNGNFNPFINVKYLGDFPSGIIQIILCSLPIGVIFQFLYNFFEGINHIPKRLYYKISKKEPKEMVDYLKKKKLHAQFHDWIKEKGHSKLLDYMSSMHETSIGFLYGSEFLLCTAFITIIFMGFQPYWLGWFLLTLGIWGFSIATYKFSREQHWRLYHQIIKLFKEYQTKEKDKNEKTTKKT